MEPGQSCILGTQRADVPFLPFLAALVAWPLCRIAADRFFRWYNPGLYDELRSDYERKYLYFFGALLGLITKPFTITACGMAVWATPPEDDIAGIRRPMNIHEQLCWGSRTAVWVSELPHYLGYPELVIHHTMTLVGMMLVAQMDNPRRGVHLNLGALWSEIPNSLRNVLKLMHYLEKHPNLDRNLNVCGTVFLFATRVPTTIMVMAMIPAQGLRGGPARTALTSQLLHLVYIFSITYWRLKSAGAWRIDDSGGFRVRITGSDRFNLNPTSLLTGVAALFVNLSVVSLYSLTRAGPAAVTKEELVSITWNSLFAIVVGLAVPRLLVSPFKQRIVNRHMHSISSVYSQAGILITAAVLYLTPTLDSSVDKVTLVACLLLSSSLAKAISQYASHLACIESQARPTAGRSSSNDNDQKADALEPRRDTTERDGKPGKMTPRQSSSETCAPSQTVLFICSIINALQYMCVVVYVATGRSSVFEAAFNTVAVQIFVRVAVDLAVEVKLGRPRAASARVGALRWRRIASIISVSLLKLSWQLGFAVTGSALEVEPSSNDTLADIHSLQPRPSDLAAARSALTASAREVISLTCLYARVSAVVSLYFRYYIKYTPRRTPTPLAPAAKAKTVPHRDCHNLKAPRVQCRLPRPRTIALAVIGLWLSDVAQIALRGEFPVSQNKGVDPAEIVAREPAICSLILSWQLWVSVMASVVAPTVAAHLWQLPTYNNNKTPGSASDHLPSTTSTSRLDSRAQKHGVGGAKAL